MTHMIIIEACECEHTFFRKDNSSSANNPERLRGSAGTPSATRRRLLPVAKRHPLSHNNDFHKWNKLAS